MAIFKTIYSNIIHKKAIKLFERQPVEMTGNKITRQVSGLIGLSGLIPPFDLLQQEVQSISPFIINILFFSVFTSTCFSPQC